MDASPTIVTAWSYGLAAVAFAALALQLAVRRKGGVLSWALLIAVSLSALWCLLGWSFARSPQIAFSVTGAIADVFRISAWCVFILLLIARARGVNELFQLRWLLFAATGLLLAGLVGQMLITFQWSVFGSPARVALLSSLSMAVFAVVLIETLFRNIPADSRWNVKPLCLGLIGAFGFDIYLYSEALLFNRIDVDAANVRGIVHALVIPLIAITAGRNHGWKLNVTLSRRIVFHSTALLASGLYLLLVAAAGYYVRFFGHEWGRAFQVALVFAGLLILAVLALSGSVRAKLKVLISKHFFSYRYDYREEWLRFTQTLSACDGQAALGQQIIRGLADMVESPSGTLWLLDMSAQRYRQSAQWNMPASDASEEVNSPLPRFLLESGWVINLEEYRSYPGHYGELALPPWLSNVPNAWLLVPLANGEELVGFVILGTARARIDVNWEVNDLFKTAGRQAASFLGQMKATEALLETRKFGAFNRMSAFVVHDLKNVVAQLSLMLKNAERHKANPEFQQDMLMTVRHSVDRMKQLMLQLRDGTTPVNAPGAVDLGDIIRRIMQSKIGLEPAPEVRLEGRVVARAHEERVERVIGHIVQNAIDATDKTGRIVLTVNSDGKRAVVEVSDTGHGMTVDFIRDRLFKPFQTTKQGGMGIGAYESYQYVQELGGDILVESQPGQGTTMRVLLPLYEEYTQAENPRAVA